MKGRDAWCVLELVEDAGQDVALEVQAGLHFAVETDFADVRGAAEERLEGVEFELLDSIGSSEITYEWIANRPRGHRRGTLGRPVFGYEVKLVRPGTSAVVGPGEEGEAWVRSRTAAPFYWRKEEATKSTFIDGWTRTGDMLRMSEDGYYQYVSRLNDVFKVSGMWVSPLEVETVISAHPDVHEVAVVGGVDAATGLARPVAFVVPRRGVEGTAQLAQELRDRVRVIGGYKVPEIHYIAALPRTPLMKIDRKSLRENLADVPPHSLRQQGSVACRGS